MKYTAIVALIAGTEAIKTTNQEKLYAAMSSEKILETTLPDWNGYHAHMNNFTGTVNEFGNFMDPYTRVIPERFVGDAAMEGLPPVDKFTQRLITEFAVEGFDFKESDPEHPKPNGKFYIDRKKALVVAKEVACTHFQKCGADADAWLSSPDTDRFNKAFDYFDVNKEERLDAVGVGTFFRYLYQPLGWVDLQ